MSNQEAVYPQEGKQMKYVIKNQETGKYVSKPGSKSSYTKRLEDARTFTESEVWKEKCGNEIAIPINHILGDY